MTATLPSEKSIKLQQLSNSKQLLESAITERLQRLQQLSNALATGNTADTSAAIAQQSQLSGEVARLRQQLERLLPEYQRLSDSQRTEAELRQQSLDNEARVESVKQRHLAEFEALAAELESHTKAAAATMSKIQKLARQCLKDSTPLAFDGWAKPRARNITAKLPRLEFINNRVRGK